MPPATRTFAIALLIAFPAIAAGQQWKPSGAQDVLPPSTARVLPRIDAPRPPLMKPIPLPSPSPSPVKVEKPIRVATLPETLQESRLDESASPKQANERGDDDGAKTEVQQSSVDASSGEVIAGDVPGAGRPADNLPPLPITAPDKLELPTASSIAEDATMHGTTGHLVPDRDGSPDMDVCEISLSNLPQPITEFCTQPDGEMVADWSGDACGDFGCGDSGCGPQRRRFLALDWLYMRPRIGGAQYGTQVIQGNSLTPGYPQDLDLDWQSGFRIGLREELDCDGSEWMVNWTRFDSDGSEEIRRQGSSDVSFATNSRPGFRARRGIAKFSDNSFQIAGRRRIRLASSSSLSLDGGVRFSRVKQQLSKIDSEPSESIFIGPFTQVDQSDTFTKFVGVGPSIGMGIEQQLRHRLSLNVGATGAMLLGRHQTTSVLTRNFPERIDRSIAESNGGRLIPVIDLTASLTKHWDTEMGHIELTGGYQMTNWFNMNNTAENFNTLTLRSTDTTVDGLFVRIAMHVW